MRKNKTAKMGIVVAILLLTVAFALISTNLTINGTASVQSNSNEFAQNVKFSTATGKEPYLTVNGTKSDENVPTVGADGKTITFTAPAFDTIGNNAELHYWIVNESTNYDAVLGSLSCTKQIEGGTTPAEEYIEVTATNSLANTTIASGATSSSDDSVKVQMIRSYTGETTLSYKITCTISATGTEKA